MILSHNQIERIGNAIIRDFENCCPTISCQQNQNAMPIERFAADYLGLDVSMARLSPDGSICGLTAYMDTEYQVSDGQRIRTIPLRQKQVLLDSSLEGPFCTGRRRFTLAHECAHQILFALEDTAAKRAMQTAYSERASYSLRELKTKEDWNEWQANVLAASLLMPLEKLKDVRCRMRQTKPVTCYGSKLDPDRIADVSNLCEAFGVSRTAMLIRLRQIGAVIDRPLSEYYRLSLDIWEDW